MLSYKYSAAIRCELLCELPFQWAHPSLLTKSEAITLDGETAFS